MNCKQYLLGTGDKEGRVEKEQKKENRNDRVHASEVSRNDEKKFRVLLRVCFSLLTITIFFHLDNSSPSRGSIFLIVTLISIIHTFKKRLLIQSYVRYNVITKSLKNATYVSFFFSSSLNSFCLLCSSSVFLFIYLFFFLFLVPFFGNLYTIIYLSLIYNGKSDHFARSAYPLFFFLFLFCSLVLEHFSGIHLVLLFFFFFQWFSHFLHTGAPPPPHYLFS